MIEVHGLAICVLHLSLTVFASVIWQDTGKGLNMFEQSEMN